MAREWQQTKVRDYVMPDAVYYQSLWAVRDLYRMEERIKELEEGERSGFVRASNIVSDVDISYEQVRPTEKHAVEKVTLENRVKAIRGALEEVPPAYRDAIMENIVKKTSVSLFPSKMWRIWKQKFLFGVARNLSLM